jgi:hypothetical protein
MQQQSSLETREVASKAEGRETKAAAAAAVISYINKLDCDFIVSTTPASEFLSNNKCI